MDLFGEYLSLGVSKEAYDFAQICEAECLDAFARVDGICSFNQLKVIGSFQSVNVCAGDLQPSTGYGYSDVSKVKLGRLFARIFGCESAIVSPLIASGTHAISVALFGLLRPGDTMLCVTGKPYDTLTATLDSFAEWGIRYAQTELKNGEIDYDAVSDALKSDRSIRMVYVQRSRGYAFRRSITINEIAKLADTVRSISEVRMVVDNCYGEFCEIKEPTDVGADVIIGSLIKNPGAGIAPTGAYIAGTAEAVEAISYRLTAPALGMEIGSYAASYLPFYQGIYFAPYVVSQALKGAILTAKAFEAKGYKVMPASGTQRTDITQSVVFNDKDKLLKFMKAVQSSSAVDSAATPIPWEQPGYDCDIVMASGSFIQGSSIELSADGPVKPPYIAYVQGGLSYEGCKLALMRALTELAE